MKGGGNVSESQVLLEVERVMNLIRGFGWSKKEEKTDGDKVSLVIEKTIKQAPPGVPG